MGTWDVHGPPPFWFEAGTGWGAVVWTAEYLLFEPCIEKRSLLAIDPLEVGNHYSFYVVAKPRTSNNGSEEGR